MKEMWMSTSGKFFTEERVTEIDPTLVRCPKCKGFYKDAELYESTTCKTCGTPMKPKRSRHIRREWV